MDIFSKLTNPKYFNDPLNCSNHDLEDLINLLEAMLKIRLVEQKIALKKKEGLIKGPVHLGAGQEAIAVGISQNLSSSDRVFGAHRSHSHILALGSDIERLFAEVLGKKSGLSKGMGGSMHLWDESVGFCGSVPIVSGTIPLAVGAALAQRMQLNKNIAVSYFGDGATEEGIFHESLNLAKVLNCPILFVCENNLFSSHMHISERQPSNSVARFAIANNIKYQVIDGNNVLEVENSSKKLINYSRKYSTPVLLEAVTFRFYGHVDWREDIDVGVNRSKDELYMWKKRDPITRLLHGLINYKKYNLEKFNNILLKND